MEHNAIRIDNAPVIFSALMNKILYPYLDKFVVDYLNDIVVYINNMEEHEYLMREVNISGSEG